MTTIKEFIDKKLSIKEDIISELKGFGFKVLPNLLDSRSSIDEIEEVFFKENLENKLEAKIFLSVKFPFRDKIISFFTHKKQVYTDLLGRTVTVKISEKNIKECREFKGRELSPFEYYLAPVIGLRGEIIGFNDIGTIVYIGSNDLYCSSSEDKESLNKASIKSKNYSSFSSVIGIYIEDVILGKQSTKRIESEEVENIKQTSDTIEQVKYKNLSEKYKKDENSFSLLKGGIFLLVLGLLPAIPLLLPLLPFLIMIGFSIAFIYSDIDK